MGTHIHCFFAREATSSPADLRAVLEGLTDDRSEDIRILRDRGRFSGDASSWSVDWDRPDDGEPDSLFGEGPAGLGITVYRRVVLVRSAERFGALYDEELRVAGPLRRLLCAIALRLGTSHRIAVAPGGMGDTDQASDRAYYDACSFESVCECLAESAGPPARTWSDLARGERTWYLGAPRPGP